ncbi:MAG TPA: hypothetical protein VFD06_00990 [Candidatus Polarisedimenticolia bacterium]|nr:hypothetical protein [Candidatus Polarisedimenticolia bacterium]
MRLPVRPLAVLSLVLLAGCASNPPARRVWVGPRIDLKPYETIGMVEFTSSSKGKLAALATRRFEEAARRDQDMLRMVDVGTRNQALASVDGDAWDAASFRAVGRKHGVKTMFEGTLTVSKVHPTVALSAFFKSGQVNANVNAALEVRMIETETGASIWSRSAATTRTLGQVSVFGGKEFVFDAADPEAAYGALVDDLVSQVAQDLQGSWQLQR